MSSPGKRILHFFSDQNVFRSGPPYGVKRIRLQQSDGIRLLFSADGGGVRP